MELAANVCDAIKEAVSEALTKIGDQKAIPLIEAIAKAAKEAALEGEIGPSSVAILRSWYDDHIEEWVDVIVWDDADPSQTGPRQIDALIEGVRDGGRLLITSGSNWQSLVSSPVARALLGKAVGDSVTVSVPKGTRELEILEIRSE